MKIDSEEKNLHRQSRSGKTMKHLTTALFLIILLSACGQTSAVDAGKAASESTATSELTETPAISQVESLLTAYMSGEEIDVSGLSLAEFSEFSTQLAEMRNAERGANPVVYNNEAYISPDNYMMMNYDGHPDMNETIQMYLPVVGKDSAGNLQILDQNEKIVTIAHSADVDWNMVVTDPHDPRIDWPNLPVEPNSGLDVIEFLFSDYPVNFNKIFITPTILLDKTMGQIFMEGRGKGFIPLFRFLTVADTDMNGIPIIFRLSLTIPAGTHLTMENGDFQTSAHGVSVLEHHDFYVNLHENSVYYMGIGSNQDAVWEKNYNTTMDAYQGLIADNEITSILTHQTDNTRDLLLLPPYLLIQKQ